MMSDRRPAEPGTLDAFKLRLRKCPCCGAPVARDSENYALPNHVLWGITYQCGARVIVARDGATYGAKACPIPLDEALACLRIALWVGRAERERSH